MSLKGIGEYLVAGLALLYSVEGVRTGSVCLRVTFDQVGWQLSLDAMDLAG